MGQESSKLQAEEIEEMQAISTCAFRVPLSEAELAFSHFRPVREIVSPSQIQTLYTRFKHLDKDNSGSISVDEMTAIPELAMNPLCRRIVAVFDSDGRGEVNFKQFVSALSVFSTGARREQKLSFAFKVYDVNGDGVISSSDLFVILKLMIGSNMDDQQVQALVDQTILEADTIDKDGAISFNEFKRALFGADLENILKIEI